MLDICIDEKCVFTHSAEDICIGIFAHLKGVFEGQCIGPCGFISFATPELVYAFREQLDFLIEGLEKEKK